MARPHRETSVFLCLTLCAIIAPAFVVGASRSVHVSSSKTTLLSGSLTSCPTPRASTCTGGLASAIAVVRNRRSTYGESHVLFPELDRQQQFVQMHPLGWGVNTLIFDHFFLAAFLTKHSYFTTTRDIEAIVNGTARALLTNLNINPLNGLAAYVRSFHVDSATGVAAVSIDSSNQPNSIDGVAAAAQTVAAARRHPDTRVVVIFYEDDVPVTTFTERLAAAVADDKYGRLSMPEVILDKISTAAPRQLNKTWIVGHPHNATAVASTRITYDDSPSTVVPRPVTVSSAAYSIEPLAAAYKDASYDTDQLYMAELAAQAGVNNPVVGQATEPMPFVRSGNLRMCMAGECPLGNFWTDAYRSVRGDQVGLSGSGGIRGSGWPIGPIRFSDIWNSQPFANTMCHGKLTGVTIWEIMNASLAMATFEGVSTPTGDRLLQVSGLRVRYSTTAVTPGSGVGARLLAIDVLDRTSGTFSPLERLTLYTFASDNFFCSAFTPAATFVQRRLFEGEVYEITDIVIHDAVATLLRTSPNVAPLREGRLVNDTTATAAQADAYNFVHTREKCAENTFWDPLQHTCFKCAAGTVSPSGGAIACAAEPSAGKTMTAVFVPVVVIVVLIGATSAAALWFRQRSLQGQVRDVANAPRDGRIAIMFTDIQDSTKLWSACPQSMSVALDSHHAIIRKAVAKHKGYEVKTAGDSFMIAVANEEAAIALALEIQMEMLATPAPAAIDAVYAANTEDELLAVEDEPSQQTTKAVNDVWHGLRVRIGLHSGEPSVTFDPVVKGYDYYGPTVNVAARTEAVARGGQIVVTSEFWSRLQAMANIASLPLGEFELKGVPDPVPLVQVLPQELAGRVFAAQDADDESGDVSDVGSVASALDDEDFKSHETFFTGLMKALPPKERDLTLKKFCKVWRIEQGATREDTAAKALVSRVVRVTRRPVVRPLDNSTRSTRTMKTPQLLAFETTDAAAHLPGELGKYPSESIAGKSTASVSSV